MTELLDVTTLAGHSWGGFCPLVERMLSLTFSALSLQMSGTAISDWELTDIRKEALTKRMAEQKDTKSPSLMMLLSLWTKSWSYLLSDFLFCGRLLYLFA